MLDIEDKVAARQLAASNPNKNIWVSASAGSGKTKVLIDRLLRLLLKGSDPNTIVCITFTQAAALEMHQRLLNHLERWAIASEEELVAVLSALDPELKITKDLTLKARQLFNLVLDTPVQIQTIHSFAQNILLSNPFENQMAFGSKLMDDVTTKNFIQKTLEKLFHEHKNGEVLTSVYKLFSQSKFEDIIHKIVSDHAFFRFILIEGIEIFQKRLEGFLRLPREKNEVMKEFNNVLSDLDFNLLLESTLATEKERLLIQNINNSLKERDFEGLAAILLTDKGTTRKRILTKKICDAYPDLTAEVYRLAQQVCDWDQELKKTKLIVSTITVIKLAELFLQTYSALKEQAGVLDYDDLIFKVIEIFSKPETAQNLLYKIDSRIHHILVDEAQDTNIYQWKVIDSIVDNFFQTEQDKSMFVVGDHKQSIFGFQGTDPDIFHRIKQYYHSQPTLKSWQDISLDVSFRSLQSILDFVDSIFENTSLISDYTPHLSFKGVGGKVIVHPLISSDDENNEDLYTAFVEQIADQIEKLIGSTFETNANHEKKIICPNDILVLIRKRGEHLDKLQQTLIERKIPFSAPNRKFLYEDSLVQFINYIILSIMQPCDDALMVKGLLNPLLNSFGITFSQVMQVVKNGEDLKEEFLRRGQKFLSSYTSLNDVYLKSMVWAVENLPVEGHNIANAFNVLEFLNEWVLGINESFYCGELSHFIHQLPIPQLNRVEENALRILTVHGAKGLQAPVVMLIDTIHKPVSRNVWVKDEAENLFLCVGNRSLETFSYQDLKMAQKANELKEYYRLLYVALTRAENELHIFGAGKSKQLEGSWYGVCSYKT